MAINIDKPYNNLPLLPHLIEQLFVHPYSKIEFLVNLMKWNRKTAASYLKYLEDMCLLRAENKGKEVIYVNIKLYELFKK